MKEETAVALELVTSAAIATHWEIPDSDDYENVMQQSSQDHVVYDHNIIVKYIESTSI